MPDLLEIENLSSGYGEAIVLSDIGFSLPDGKSLALLGRNGTGKTTLINTIVGLTRRRSGVIRLDGRDIARERPERLHAQLDIRDVGGSDAFDLRLRNPSGAHEVARATVRIGLGGDTMTDGVLTHIAVLKIRDALIPLVFEAARPRIRTGDEPIGTAQRQPHLEGERRVGRLDRLAVVHDEHGHGLCAHR